MLHYTPHCVVVTALGAELASCASHTERRLVPTGANRRRGTSRDRHRGTSCPKGEMSAANESTGDDQEHTPLRQGRERAELPHGWQRCGAEELRDELGS